ncbi:MAG: DUF885 domain-containing protein, partial [Maricaulaceae bacterium]
MRALTIAGTTTIGALILLSGCASMRIDAESRALTAYLDAEFEEQLAFSPEFQTSLGRKTNYDQLDDRSEAAADAQLEWRRESVAEMEARFDVASLNDDARLSYEIWRYALERAERAAQFRRHDFVFGRYGEHSSIPTFLINNHRVDDAADMEDYNARLRALGPALDQSLERAQLAAEDGIRMPRFDYERTIAEARGLLDGLPFTETEVNSPLFADAKEKINALYDAGEIDDAEADALLSEAEAALLDFAGPAYERVIRWAQADIDNAPSGVVGAIAYPDGEAWYETALALNTTTDMTADEVHELGLSEVARIQAQMEAIKDEVGFEGSLAEFFIFTRTDDQFYLPNTDEGRAEYLARAENIIRTMEARLPDYFGLLPEAPLEVRRVEAFREEDGGAAHYRAAAPDGSRPGTFYSHLSDMRAMPTYHLERVSYHEGLPGHHLQISIARELEDVPTFRTVYGYSAYSEGWGLYSEELAKEMGFYEDPYSEFGQLAGELWRAVRLVVDTGIHAKGWSEEEAV